MAPPPSKERVWEDIQRQEQQHNLMRNLAFAKQKAEIERRGFGIILNGINYKLHWHNPIMILTCRHCKHIFTVQGLKDKHQTYSTHRTNYEQWSASECLPDTVKLSGDFHWNDFCDCVQQPLICAKCCTIVGNKVTVPCMACLETENTGHLWLFDPNAIVAIPRYHHSSDTTLAHGEMHGMSDSEIEVENIKHDIQEQFKEHVTR